MAAAYRSIATVTTNSGANVTINKPSGVVSGDVLVAFVCARCSPQTVSSVPSGWTLLGTSLVGSASMLKAYWKLAGGSEPSNYTWTLGATPTGVASSIVAISGSAGSGLGESDDSGSSNTPSVVGPAVTNGGISLFCALMNNASITFTSTGMTEVADISGASFSSAEVCWKLWTGGSIGTLSTTATSSSNWATMCIAVPDPSVTRDYPLLMF